MKTTGHIIDGRYKTIDPKKLAKFAADNEGLWFEMECKIPGKKIKCPKSKQQLGFYFAHLLPEILKQMIADGHTYTINFEGFHQEILYDKYTAHEMITSLCGHVGEDGKAIRLSDPDMDIGRASQFINNVLDLAVVGMKMNEKNLKARMPK